MGRDLTVHGKGVGMCGFYFGGGILVLDIRFRVGFAFL